MRPTSYIFIGMCVATVAISAVVPMALFERTPKVTYEVEEVLPEDSIPYTEYIEAAAAAAQTDSVTTDTVRH